MPSRRLALRPRIALMPADVLNVGVEACHLAPSAKMAALAYNSCEAVGPVSPISAIHAAGSKETLARGAQPWVEERIPD
jgi:hypothetical protein